MPARESESLILRTYPYREADLIVSFFTRDQGKLRGIARGVRRPKNRFGSGLERLSHVRLFYFLRENQEPARLDRSDLLGPPVFLRADYATSVALDVLAEVSEQLLPEHEANDAYFRLLLLVLAEFWSGLNRDLSVSRGRRAEGSEASGNGRATGTLDTPSEEAAPIRRAPAGVAAGERPGAPGWLWRAVTYFELWAVRLGGWLPPLNLCINSGAEFAPDETVYFGRSQPGLFSASFRNADSWAMSPASRVIAQEILRKPLPQLAERPWRRETASDLRRFLTQRLEAQFEHRLKSAAVLEQL